MSAMPTVTAVNLTNLSQTYTVGVGDHVINGQGGDNTITAGAGNNTINVLAGNNTITAGAGDSIVHSGDGNNTITTGAGVSIVAAGDGNNTITTGAGASIVAAGDGNNTITTGAGDSIVTAGDGNNTITTGAGDSVIEAGDGNNTVTAGAGHNLVSTGTGNDTITTGAGDDVINAGGGVDIVDAGAGHDVLIYVAAENKNVISNDLYSGGTGFDTLQLVFTRAEWMRADIQADVANYLAFLAASTGANGGDSSASFTFSVLGLTASKMEKLAVTVDGVAIDPANHPVTLGNDAVSTSENLAAATFDVLANDSVPDLINSLTYSDPAHGSVQLAAAYLVTAEVPSANFIYTPNAGFYDYLAVGESATDAFTYTVTDASGDVKTATVTVTITGSNDAPVITAEELSGAVTEQVAPVGNLIDTGTISFTDVDLRDMHLVSAHGTPVGSNLGNLTAALVTDTTNTGAGGKLAWTYTVSDSAVEYLAKNQIRVESFTITLDDQNGSVTTKQIDVLITGTNDAPVAVNDIGSATTASNASGNVLSNDTDVDTAGASFRVSAVRAGGTEGGGSAGVPGAALAGAHGTLTLNADGNYSYAVNQSDAAVRALAVGGKLTDTFNYTMTDGSLDDMALLTVTIDGVNHAPVAVADSGTSISANGSVNVSFSPMGSAYASGASNEYVITQALNSQVGALWSNSKVSLNASFSISADLFFGANDYGADGFSFIIQNNSKTTIGASGQGLGYANITKSFGIEFDTYYNGDVYYNGQVRDIWNDHAAFNTGGMMNAIGGAIDLGNIEDNQYHAVKIDWNASSHVVTLSYGGNVIGSRTIDVAAQVGANEAYIGFAGSTGESTNLQMIRNLNYQSANNSVVLDVLVNDTDIDLGDKAGLKVVAATSDHGATVAFSGVAGAGIDYSPAHAFDYLATNKIVIDTVTYVIQDSHGAQATSTVQVAIAGVNNAPTIVQTVLGDAGNNTLVGTSAADYINGLGGNDILTGLAGNDLLTGGAGSDTFVFSPGGGADIITDFMAGVDMIDLRGFAGMGYASLADVSSHSTQTGADLIIDMGGTNSIQLTGVNLASLHAADFAFA